MRCKCGRAIDGEASLAGLTSGRKVPSREDAARRLTSRLAAKSAVLSRRTAQPSVNLPAKADRPQVYRIRHPGTLA